MPQMGPLMWLVIFLSVSLAVCLLYIYLNFNSNHEISISSKLGSLNKSSWLW